MPERTAAPGQQRIAAVALAAIVAAVVGSVVLVATVFTPLQEVSFRWMGLAGVALPTATALATVSTAAVVLRCWATAPGRARSATVGIGLVVPWALVLVLAAPTLGGMLAPEHAGDGAELRVLSQNLWYQNPDPRSTARQLLARDADVMVLVEYTPEHAAALRAEGALEQYPYRWEEPGDLGGGLAVMSKVPMEDVERVDTWSGAVRAELATDGGPVELYAVHPVAPSDFWGLRNWKGDYRTLTAALGDAGPATVVAGDFNATGAHRRFRELMSRSGLRDARDVSGSGFGPTWPGTGWIPPLMRLDHVLVGDGVGADGVELLDDVGADHRGVEATLRVPRR